MVDIDPMGAIIDLHGSFNGVSIKAKEDQLKLLGPSSEIIDN